MMFKYNEITISAGITLVIRNGKILHIYSKPLCNRIPKLISPI